MGKQPKGSDSIDRSGASGASSPPCDSGRFRSYRSAVTLVWRSYAQLQFQSCLTLLVSTRHSKSLCITKNAMGITGGEGCLKFHPSVPFSPSLTVFFLWPPNVSPVSLTCLEQRHAGIARITHPTRCREIRQGHRSVVQVLRRRQ